MVEEKGWNVGRRVSSRELHLNGGLSCSQLPASGRRHVGPDVQHDKPAAGRIERLRDHFQDKADSFR